MSEPETKTGEQIRKTAETFRDELQKEAIGPLEEVRRFLESLIPATKGVNGTSATIRAKAKELEQIVSVLKGEADGFERKLLGKPKPVEITERVAHKEVA